jgi:hypothetical protein
MKNTEHLTDLIQLSQPYVTLASAVVIAAIKLLDNKEINRGNNEQT